LAKRACLPVGRVGGDYLIKFSIKSPLIPLFQRGRTIEYPLGNVRGHYRFMKIAMRQEAVLGL